MYPDEDCVRAYVAARGPSVPATQLEAYVEHYERRLSVQDIADRRGEAYNAPRLRLKRLRRSARRWWARGPGLRFRVDEWVVP